MGHYDAADALMVFKIRRKSYSREGDIFLMSEKEMINHYKAIISESRELEEALYDACDFSFADMYVVKNGEDWLDCGKSDYKIEVFGNDASGGVYVLLNDRYVGFISSEGETGIVAKNVKDFFNIICYCKNLFDYFIFYKLDNVKEFVDMVNTQNEKVEEKHKALLNQFLQDNEMETEPEKVYSMFVSAVIVEPEFIIEPTLPGYDRLDSLFAFNKDKYLKELRKKHF